MDEATIEIRVRARAGKNELGGFRDGRLQVRVTAPPLEGKADRAVRKLVAKRIGVAPSRVKVVRGERSRDKLLAVDGLSPAALMAALGESE